MCVELLTLPGMLLIMTVIASFTSSDVKANDELLKLDELIEASLVLIQATVVDPLMFLPTNLPW